MEPGAGPHRHGADTDANPRGQEDHAELSRRAWPRQPTHDLADRGRLSRGGADTGVVMRAAKGFPQFPDRPRHRRGLSRGEISGTARHPARKMAAEPGLGSAQGYLKGHLKRIRKRIT